ncbi:hypothetical protein ES332_A02G166000v1 [Gossypium tomentosum]|uniref:Uncharacterized protein n=1 Tax=Gossypium tomentosum TaxID=34277 RepID=A0A5D2RJ55_GOSTO|nr:hypothetical protein ES332_A02G166000v1 [Gossypium tomentosum]
MRKSQGKSFKTLFSQNFSTSFPLQSTKPKGSSLFASTLSNRTPLNPIRASISKKSTRIRRLLKKISIFASVYFFYTHK